MNKLLASIHYLLRKRLTVSDDFINATIKDVQVKIEQEQINNYNSSVENGYTNDFMEQIHPVFFSKTNWYVIEHLQDLLCEKIEAKLLKTIVHTAEQYHFYCNIPIGCNLNIKSKIWKISPHNKGTKITIKLAYYYSETLVVEAFSSGIFFGVKCNGNGQCHGDFPKIKKIEHPVIWQKSISINKQLPYIYAEKAKIDSPIHTNPDFAKSIGLPNNILQGSCTFAKSTGLILSEEANGADTEIEAVSVRFTGMLIPPDNIKVRLLIKQHNTFYFDVLNDNNELVIDAGMIRIRNTNK